MYNKKLLSLTLFSIICLGQASAIEITGLKAGQLKSANISADETTLTISGEMNADDFSYIFDNLNKLRSLNIANVSILEYKGDPLPYTGMTSSPAKTIPAYALACLTNLANITLPSNLLAIGKGALSGSGITTLTIPPSVTSIGDYAMMRCPDLKSVTMSSNVTSIGTRAFAYCPQLAAITLSSALPAIPEGLLEACGSLKKINLEDLTDCQEIGSWALAECNGVTTLLLPESTEVIGKFSLYGDSFIETLVLPASVTEIQEGAMGKMTSLSTLMVDKLDYIPELGNNVWAQVKQSEVKLVTPDDQTSDYQNADQWKNFNIIPHSQYLSSTLNIESEIAPNTLNVSVSGGIMTVKSTGESLNKVAVFNAAGQRVAMQSADNECRFDVSAWTPGVYLVVSNSGVAKTII